MNPMKIAYVYDAVYPYVRGGVEKRIHEIAIRLAARGHEIHLYGMKWWDGPDTIMRDGVTLHGVCPKETLYVNGRRGIPQAIRFACSVYRPLLRTASDADIIDCQNFPYFSCFFAHRVAKQLGIPLAITWHEVWGEYWYEYLGRYGIFGKIIEARAAALPHHPIAVSPMTARALEGLGVYGTVMPNGIDLEQMASVAPAEGCGEWSGQCSGQSDILFTGRLIKEKHVDILLRALASVQQEIPDICATIIGDGPERPALEALADELGLSDAVCFTGFLPGHDGVIAAMKAAKVFVLPSTREGFGIAALEAMACGLPVVTVNHPQNAALDLVEDGVCGYRCPLSPEGVAEGIKAALAGRDQMQDALIRNVREYQWDAIIEKLLQVYNKAGRG